MERMFKIRRLSDGQCSRGGSVPYWTKRGKLWNGLAPLKAHLSLVTQCWEGTNIGRAQVNQPPVKFAYEDCVIDELALTVVQTVEVGLADTLKKK